MSVVVLAEELLRQMVADAEGCYPRECCGIVIGRREGERKIVTEIASAPNTQPEPVQDYFVMDPKVSSEIEDRVYKAEDIEVLGYYHSHPDHPARPSPRDLDAARDLFHITDIRYSYIILACHDGKVVETTSWTLAEGEQSFEFEELDVSAT